MGNLRWAFFTGVSLSLAVSVALGVAVYFHRRRVRALAEERRILEAQLMQSQKMESIGTLAGGIAHDLNNQLTPLWGYLELAMSETPPGTAAHGYLQEVSHATRRCTEVVRQLLNFSRPSSKKKEVIDLAALLRNFKKSFVSFLPSTVETKVVFPDDLKRVYGNATELETVLLNLVTNARDAMPAGGLLTIDARNAQLGPDDSKGKGSFVVLTVTDSGTGIPEDVIPKIFDPFFSTKRKNEGTGLGLTMVYRIVKEHGGWVGVSTKAGRGSEFHVYLPVTQDAAAAPAPAAAAPPRGTETVLFADDEPALRSLGKAMLERLGYHPILAADGEEAASIYAKEHARIDAVVLDMTMPKLSGRDTMKRILQVNPKAKILLVSGYTAEGTGEELMQEGARDFLAKPYEVAGFARALRRMLDAH